MSTLSTHVLDTAAGLPGDRASGSGSRPARATPLGEAVTDARRPDRLASGRRARAPATTCCASTPGLRRRLLPRGGRRVHGRRRPPPPRAGAAEPLRLLDLPWQLTCVLRARRAVVGGAEVAACVGVTGERIAAVTAYDDAAGRRAAPSTLGRRRGAAARPGRHPRARQRAGPHRVGGVRHRDPGGRGRRRDHDPRHAAQLDPADDDASPALDEKRAVAEGQVRVDVGFWGGAVPGNLADLAPLHEAGVFGFKCFLLDSGVEEFGHLEPDGVRRGDDGDRPARRADDRARRGRRTCSTRARSTAPHYAGFLASRPRAAEDARSALVIEQAAADRRPRPRRAPEQRRRRTRAATRPARPASTSASRPARTT